MSRFFSHTMIFGYVILTLSLLGCAYTPPPLSISWFPVAGMYKEQIDSIYQTKPNIGDNPSICNPKMAYHFFHRASKTELIRPPVGRAVFLFEDVTVPVQGYCGMTSRHPILGNGRLVGHYFSLQQATTKQNQIIGEMAKKKKENRIVSKSPPQIRKKDTTFDARVTPQHNFFENIGADFSKLDRAKKSKAFGICRAAYLVLAVGDNASLFRQQANGAGIAIGMIPVEETIEFFGGINSKRPSNQLQLLEAISIAKRAGQMVMQSETEVHRTRMTTALSSDRAMFANMIGDTLDTCIANLDHQQEFIDLWRDLAAGGWIQIK